MKTKMKSAILHLALILLVCLLSGCGAGLEKDIIGKWYNSDGKCLDIRTDNTWKLEDSYGTGTWKILDDKVTFEFTDFYGDTQESNINENELGKYIDFGYYGDFYKDSYPTIAEINQDDLFDEIKLNVLGASPLCKVSVDTSNCSDYVKENINFSIDAGYYDSGETVTVYANMKGDSKNETAQKKEFTIESSMQYVDSVDEIDTSILNNAIQNYLEAEKNSYGNDESEFYRLFHKNQEIVSATLAESGFLKLETEEIEAMKTNNTTETYYNAYYCIYVINVINHNNNKTYNYAAEVLLYNICKNQDGELTWNIKGLEEETPDVITGKCYTSKSDFAKWGDCFSYYKNEKYNLSIIYTNDNISFENVD